MHLNIIDGDTEEKTYGTNKNVNSLLKTTNRRPHNAPVRTLFFSPEKTERNNFCCVPFFINIPQGKIRTVWKPETALKR